MVAALSIGDPGLEFNLHDLAGSAHRLSDFRGQITILNFWSAECPWSARADQELIPALAHWKDKAALVTVACNANEPLDLIKRTAAERNLPFVLHDPHQEAANLYGAVTSPHFFVLDAMGILRYQGALDDITFREREPSRHFLVEAVEALIKGRDPDPSVTPPYGCIIVRYSL